jgi:hypothetical protein
MGLLDLLNSQGGSGLLDFLRANSAAAIANNPGAMQSDTANYAPGPMSLAPQAQPQIMPANQPNSMDTAQWPQGPVGAPMNANAAMPQPQPAPMSMAGPPAAAPPAPAPQPAPAAPAGDSRLMLGLKGFLGNLSGGPIGALAGGAGALVTGLPTDPTTIEAQKTAKIQNATSQALLAKGADPTEVNAAAGNPELLKTLITKYYGPQTVQSLGNGYIADKNGKVSRAYEPDDKVPVGFRKTDNGLQPIPGGPADPSYLRSKKAGETDPNAVHVLGRGGELYRVDEKGNPVVVHKNDQGDAEATLPDDTTKAMAAQYLAGDRTVMQNLGRGAQGAANIVKLRTEIYHQANSAGLDGRGIVDNFNEQAGALAGQRTVGTRAANISLAANEANNMIPIAVAASEAVPRTQYVPVNKAIQMVQTGSSSPELARFVAATNSLVNAYVRAVSPSGVPTDSMREHAYSMLNSAQSHDAYVAVTKIMQDEMKAALTAPGQVQKELRRSPEAGAQEAPAAAPKPGNYVWTPTGGLVGAK